MSKNSTDESNALLEYGKTVLVDELIFRSYHQSMQRAQGLAIGSAPPEKPDTEKALHFSRLASDTLREAEIKRNAFFTKESIDAHFGLIKQIRNTGTITGRILAFLLKNF